MTIVLDSCVMADYYSDDTQGLENKRKKKLEQKLIENGGALISSACAAEVLYLLKKYSNDLSYQIVLDHFARAKEFVVADERKIEVIEQAALLRSLNLSTEATMTAAIAKVNDATVLTARLPAGADPDEYTVLERKRYCRVERI
ncbi:MAG: PIN domain-containing protein [Armatimonadota bacterium]